MSRERRVREIQRKNGSALKKAGRFPSNNRTCQSNTLLTQLVQNVNDSERTRRKLQADNDRIRQQWGMRKEDGWMMCLCRKNLFGVRLGFPSGENDHWLLVGSLQQVMVDLAVGSTYWDTSMVYVITQWVEQHQTHHYVKVYTWILTKKKP